MGGNKEEIDMAKEIKKESLTFSSRSSMFDDSLRSSWIAGSLFKGIFNAMVFILVLSLAIEVLVSRYIIYIIS